MKTTLLFSVRLAGLLLAAQTMAAADVATGLNAELYVVQQATSQSSAGRTRADSILAAVLDAARNGFKADAKGTRTAESIPVGANLDAASLQAAYSAMAVLYSSSLPSLDAWLAQSLAGVEDNSSAIADGRKWGEHVAQVVLAEQNDAVLLNADTFAESVQPPTSPASPPEVQAAPSADQAAIGAGRYQFSVLAGAPGTKGYVDGIGVAARFDNPSGIAVDAAGNAYVSEHDLCIIRKISADGVVTTLAGTAGQAGSQDGAGAAARFNHPSGLAVDAAGNILVADTGNSTVRKIDLLGNVTTLAGTAGASGSIDGTRQSARFFAPAYLAVDTAGNVFLSEDAYYDRAEVGIGSPIRKIAPDGTVSTLTITVNVDGWFYGSTTYEFTPQQICVDAAGNLYVIDSNGWDYTNVFELTPTTAGGHYTASQILPPDREFSPPNGSSIWATGIGVDATGTLFLRSEGNPLYTYSPNSGWQPRYVTGDSDLDDSSWMEQVAVGKSGELYILHDMSDDSSRAGAVVVGVFDPSSTGPTILTQPGSHTFQRGGSAHFQVTVAGTAPFSYQWSFNSSPISGANSADLEINNVQSGVLGFYSVVVTDGVGSVSSRKANLSMSEPPTPYTSTATTTIMPTSPIPVTSPSTGASTTSSGGGGSLDPRSSLAVLLLLAAKAVRRRHRASSAGAA